MSKIFVSSTFEDLKDYRKAVLLQLRRMGHEDIAMEYFVPENERPLDKCLKAVAKCDLYLGIFAWRYGYIPPTKKKSMTELEYREAVKLGKPCQIFLLDEDAPWMKKFIDTDENAKKNDKLRKELSTKYQRICFKNPDDLASVVGAAVHNWEMDTGKSPKKEIVKDLDIKSYTEAIGMKYKTLDLDTLIPSKKEAYIRIQLSNVFVEQNVRENPPPMELPKEILIRIQEEWGIDKKELPDGLTYDDIKRAKESYYSKASAPVLDVITDIKNKYLVILGDPGSGKSMLARYVLLSIVNYSGLEALSVYGCLG